MIQDLRSKKYMQERFTQKKEGLALSLPKGFTLVELLMYMGIFMILLIVFLQLFSSILDVSLESQSTSAVSIDGKYILARLTYDLQNATSVVTPANVGDTRSSLEVISNGADEDFVLSNNNLVLNNISANTFDTINSAETTVSNLSFTRLGTQNGKPTVTISFTLTGTAKRTSGLEVRNFTTTVGLR
jgi:type II secretory pathway pseudopilin PulG